MSTAIAVELDALCLLLLCTVAYQSEKNLNQQKGRVLFRATAYGIIAVSFLHIIAVLLSRRGRQVPRQDIKKLLKFYLIPIIGSIVGMFKTGMPGTWTCGAISMVLIYLDDQNREVMHGMINAMAADYRSIYYANLDTDECICVRAADKSSSEHMWEGKLFPYLQGFRDYAELYIAEEDKEAFYKFIEPDNIRAGLAKEPMISHRYLANYYGREQYEMLRIAGVVVPLVDGGHDLRMGGERPEGRGAVRRRGGGPLRLHPHGYAYAGDGRPGRHTGHPGPGPARRRGYPHHRPDGQCLRGGRAAVPGRRHGRPPEQAGGSGQAEGPAGRHAEKGIRNINRKAPAVGNGGGFCYAGGRTAQGRHAAFRLVSMDLPNTKNRW